MVPEPLPSIRRWAATLRGAGAALVAGHSAHVFHGVEEGVLYDLGGFLDDYAVDGQLRNDLGLLFLVDLEQEGPARLEAVPLKLEDCYTHLATGNDAEWIGHRFRETCRAFGTEVADEQGPAGRHLAPVGRRFFGTRGEIEARSASQGVQASRRLAPGAASDRWWSTADGRPRHEP